MRLQDILSVIHSPSKTFERICDEKPTLVDSLLMFGFVYVLLLGIVYVVFSTLEYGYGMGEIAYWFVNLSAVPFLSNPGVGSFLLSVGLGVADILVLTGLVHVIARKSSERGSFSALVMMFSLAQITSVLSVVGFVVLFRFIYSGLSLAVVPIFTAVIGIFLWKFGLYFLGIRKNYRLRYENVFLVLIVAVVLHAIISVFVMSFVVRSDVIYELISMSRTEVSKVVVD